MSGSRVARADARRARSSCVSRFPGLYNVYNALAALTAALRLGIDAAEAACARSSRCRRCSAGSRRSTSAATELSILLIKNPAGANEVLRTLLLEAGRR